MLATPSNIFLSLCRFIDCVLNAKHTGYTLQAREDCYSAIICQFSDLCSAKCLQSFQRDDWMLREIFSDTNNVSEITEISRKQLAV